MPCRWRMAQAAEKAGATFRYGDAVDVDPALPRRPGGRGADRVR